MLQQKSVLRQKKVINIYQSCGEIVDHAFYFVNRNKSLKTMCMRVYLLFSIYRLSFTTCFCQLQRLVANKACYHLSHKKGKSNSPDDYSQFNNSVNNCTSTIPVVHRYHSAYRIILTYCHSSVILLAKCRMLFHV